MSEADVIATIRAVLKDEDKFDKICEDFFTEFDKDGSGEIDTVIDTNLQFILKSKNTMKRFWVLSIIKFK